MVILMLFSPQGRHAAPIGVKFGVMESTKVNSMTDIPKATSPMPNFTPIGALVACGAKKLKMLPNFYQILEHKLLASAYPLHDFYQIFTERGQLYAGSSS